ncbi:hypothetical protein RZP13_28375, partial [Klebsiella quasipneumoniae subsp. similipneumoniae]|nr:hypothetical protein [Klebsiella quasipneumoniae subsp. similipneumoniae]
KSAQIREILISESAWEEMTCLFAPSLAYASYDVLVHQLANLLAASSRPILTDKPLPFASS